MSGLTELRARVSLETGARRQGALGLPVADLDDERSIVWLHEKNDSDREQPVAPTLLEQLIRLARQRGGTAPADHVFWSLGGRAITARHYDTCSFAFGGRCPGQPAPR